MTPKKKKLEIEETKSGHFKCGEIHAEKILYFPYETHALGKKDPKANDREWVTFWQAISEKNDDLGCCWDVGPKNLDEIIEMCNHLKKIKPRILKETKEDYEFDIKWKEKEEKWYIKLYEELLEDITVQFRPFEWKATRSIITKENVGRNTSKWVSGFHFGPLVITFGRNWKHFGEFLLTIGNIFKWKIK